MPENRAALRGFLHLTIRDDIRIAQALSEYGVAEERFVDDLLKFSAGSWVYVHYVLKLIELDPAAVGNLPLVYPAGWVLSTTMASSRCAASPQIKNLVSPCSPLSAQPESH